MESFIQAILLLLSGIIAGGLLLYIAITVGFWVVDNMDGQDRSLVQIVKQQLAFLARLKVR